MSWKEALPVPKVLIAEDDLMMAEVLESALVASGYEVCGIESHPSKGRSNSASITGPNSRFSTCRWPWGLGTDVANSISGRGRVGILYASGSIDTTGLTGSDGEACIAKPYRTQVLCAVLKLSSR